MVRSRPHVSRGRQQEMNTVDTGAPSAPQTEQITAFTAERARSARIAPARTDPPWPGHGSRDRGGGGCDRPRHTCRRRERRDRTGPRRLGRLEVLVQEQPGGVALDRPPRRVPGPHGQRAGVHGGTGVLVGRRCLAGLGRVGLLVPQQQRPVALDESRGRLPPAHGCGPGRVLGHRGSLVGRGYLAGLGRVGTGSATAAASGVGRVTRTSTWSAPGARPPPRPRPRTPRRPRRPVRAATSRRLSRTRSPSWASRSSRPATARTATTARGWSSRRSGAAAWVSSPGWPTTSTAATTVTASQLRRGDLLFWSEDGSAQGIERVAIYLGGNQYVEAARPGSRTSGSPASAAGTTRPTWAVPDPSLIRP